MNVIRNKENPIIPPGNNVKPSREDFEVHDVMNCGVITATAQYIPFHDIKPQFLQNYLDEFCYKFNRRYHGEALFNRLLVAAVSYKNEFEYKYR